MTPFPLRRLLRAAAILTSAITTFAGCAAMETGQSPAGRSAEASPAPARAISDFSGALRCMDTLLLDYGTRDLAVIVEDVADPTQRVKAGTKDILISVVSDMTQKSRAIRLVASGKDWGNTVSHLGKLKPDQFSVVPQFALRGTIGQTENAGAAAVLTLDLALLSTQDLSIVPGTATRNAMVLTRNAKGVDANGEIRKFGSANNISFGSGDGHGQAVRTLAELASIELFGKLAKVPYWTCLGATDANAAVTAEIQDWYDALAAQPAEIIKYFQHQLRQRRVYDGPIDGTVSPALKEAVAAYREALGLTREPKLSLDFFQAYLRADHYRVEAQARKAALAAVVAVAAATPAAAAPAVAAPERAAPLSVRISAVNNVRQFAAGEAIHLSVQPSRDAHVYCFLQDENRKIVRFFPNRFQRDSRVPSGEALVLPGSMRFEISMNKRGAQETVSCFATERDVLAQLPAGVNGGDFDPLPVANLDQVRVAFVKASGGALAQESFQIRPR